jgi:hypothetical protein
LGRFAGQTEEERHCREVIALAEEMLQDRSPEEAAFFTALLEEEVQHLRDHPDRSARGADSGRYYSVQ